MNRDAVIDAPILSPVCRTCAIQCGVRVIVDRPALPAPCVGCKEPTRDRKAPPRGDVRHIRRKDE